MIDYIAAIATESRRFSQLIQSLRPEVNVPSCSEWNLADLAWHLTEVQYFWASIATDLLESPEGLAELERPHDSELAELFDAQSKRLVAALTSHQPEEVCWSWHDSGHTIGWLRRRQAHEALIHRVDAELAAGTVSAIDTQLAADGVDEILTVMLDASSLPEWASFVADGRTAGITTDEGRTWSMLLGRFQGTSPATGNTYDDSALLLAPVDRPPTVSIRGAAPDLDLWLWGRGPIDPMSIAGDATAAADIRAAAVAGTQ